ncbi:MAG: MFS transporter [Chloroflexi bacterium]|nr:MFS transporter [Chloroflexota bacterium]OJV89952.1 MAG: hypothetical protein BGO39_34475 [Chloroflexi bacterium 54-19]
MEKETLTAGSYRRLLQTNRNFRRLWLAQVVSLLGDWFSTVAVITLVTRFGGTAEQLAWLFIARLLPMVLFGPLAGVLADRFNRRSIMLVADLTRVAVALSFLLVTSAELVWLIYLLTVVQFSLGALFDPARSAIIPALTSNEDRVTANALGSLTWSTMLAIGAALGGLTAGVFGLEVAFVVDALSFAGSAFMVLGIPAHLGKASGHKDTKMRLGSDLVDGAKYLRQRPAVLTFTLIKPLAALSSGATFTLLALLSHDVFPVGKDGSLSLGLLNLAIGVGSGVGPLLGSWLLRRRGETRANLQRMIGLGFILYGLSFIFFTNTGSLLIAIVVIIIGEFGGGSNWVNSTTLLQLGVEDSYRGRVFAVEFMLLNLLGSISALVSGWLLDQLHLPVGTLGIGLGILEISIGLLWLGLNLRARRLANIAVATAD